MTDKETTIRVNLDTAQAEKDLKRLAAAAQGIRGGAGGGGRGGRGGGGGLMNSLGMGAAIGAGLGAARGFVSSEIGDIFRAGTMGLGGDTANAIGRQFGIKDLTAPARYARALGRANQETVQTFAAIAGQLGEVPKGSLSYAKELTKIYRKEEDGAQIMRSALGSRGRAAIASVSGPVGRVGQPSVESVEKAIEKFIERGIQGLENAARHFGLWR